MKRCEVAANLYLLKYVFVYKGAAGEELAAMHDTVTYSLDVLYRSKNAVLFVCQGFKHQLHSFLVVRNGQIPYDFLSAGGGVLENTHGKTYFFYDTLCNKGVSVVTLHIKELILDG